MCSDHVRSGEALPNAEAFTRKRSVTHETSYISIIFKRLSFSYIILLWQRCAFLLGDSAA